MTIQLPVLNCDGCGACCQSIGHPQFWRHKTGADADPHWQRLPGHLKDEINEHVASLEEADMFQPCIWFDKQSLGCRHYDYRPQMCRDFEVDSEHCRRMRVEQGIESA